MTTQLITQLCKAADKNMFELVRNPVRSDEMRLYSVLIDLSDTYHWSQNRIAAWMRMDLTRCVGHFVAR